MGTQVKKKRIRGFIGFIVSVLTIGLLTYLTYMVISEGGISALKSIPKIFLMGAGDDFADEFIFDTGKSRVFADLEGAVVSAGTLGLQMHEMDGVQIVRDSFQMEYPAVSSNSGHAVVFDIGGYEVRTLDTKGIKASAKAAGEIYSASINKNGWFCVSNREVSEFTSSATVYNSDGKSVYKSYSAEGHILKAVLSGDNRSLAVLALTGGGSKVSLYNLNNEDATAVFALDGGLIIDIEYLTDGKILAVTTDSIMMIDKNGYSETVYSFEGRHFSGYSLDGTYIALYLLDYSLGTSGIVVTLKTDGTIIGELTVYHKITSVSLKDKTLSLLSAEGLSFYNRELTEHVKTEEIDTVIATVVLTLGSNQALVAGDYFASVLSAEQ